jgi:serine/threonine protein kinase
MEFMPGGSLFQHISKFGNLSEAKTEKYTLQTLEGLEYIHGCSIHGKTLVHSDLKCTKKSQFIHCLFKEIIIENIVNIVNQNSMKIGTMILIVLLYLVLNFC